MGDCPLCGQPTLHQCRRLIQDSCGHFKCRLCILEEEDGCSICKQESSLSPSRILLNKQSLPFGLSDSLNYSSHQIILSLSPSQKSFVSPSYEQVLTLNEISNDNTEDNQRDTRERNDANFSFECNEQNNGTTVTELIDMNAIISETYNCLSITSNQIIEECSSLENRVEAEAENSNCNQIVKSSNYSKSYRSPEFNMSDYLLFKNPYAQYLSCLSPEFRLSDYIVIKSPTRIENIDQPYKSPIRNYGGTSPTSTKSDCLILSKKSPVRNDSIEECQTEHTICYMLNSYGELVKLSNYIITEFIDNSTTTKKLMIDYVTPENQTSHNIQDSNEKETCIIQEVSECSDKFNNLLDNRHENNCDSNSNKKIVHAKKSVPVIKKVKRVKRNKATEENSSSDKIKPFKKRKVTDDLVKPRASKRRKANKDWSHIEKIQENPNRYKCTVCKKVFKCLQSRVYHSACLLGIVPFKCTFKDCDRTFNIRSNFEYHQKVHSGEKPFECDDCKKKFIDKNRLIRHMMNVHNQYTVKCHDCGKKFRSKEYLKQHVVIHQGKSFKCKFCSKVFSLDGNRRRHEISHSSERPHKCDVCSATFKTKFLLTRHKRIHGSHKPYSCKHCHQVFLSKSEVQRHVLSHFDEKPFSCKICNLHFRRKDNLKRHIKHHHPEEDSDKLVVINDSSLKKDKSMANNAIEKLSSPKSKFTPNIISRPNSFFKVRSSPKAQLFGPFDNWGLKINEKISIKELPKISNKAKENKLMNTTKSNDRKIATESKTEYSNIKKHNESQTVKSNLHKHWRRRITESLKSQNS